MRQFWHFFSLWKRMGHQKDSMLRSISNRGPDASHPVAVEAPDEVVADEALELVAREVDPVGRAVLRHADEDGQRRVDDDFDEADDPEQQGRRGRSPSPGGCAQRR